MERVLVTGAGRGLGLALTTAFLRRGCIVGGTVRRPEGADALRALAADHPDRVHMAFADVADEDALAAAVRALAGTLDGLDVLVNCAGINARSTPGGMSTLSVATVTADPMLAMYAVNVVAPLVAARAALPHLRASARGRIVNVSSWLGSVTTTRGAGNYGYAASKAALGMVTRLLANELREGGVTVIAVNPGWVRTEMGGPRAGLSPEESAEGIADVVAGLTPAQSGAFLQWDGSPHPW